MSEPLDLDAALDRAMAESGLDEIWRGTVRGLLDRDDALWRRCCGHSCDPCALTLGRVVDRVRQLSGAPGASEP